MADTGHELQSLVRRCNQGDKQAWEEFYARYFSLVSCAANKYCSSQPSEVEDIIQEVFINLFKALKYYDPARSLEAYILEIVRRVRISGYRKTSAAKRGGNNPGPRPLDIHDGDHERGYISLASANEDQETSLIKAQETHLLRKALDSLSESCRSLLGLRYDKGFSYKEIAESLGVKEVTLRSQVQRCLSSLARNYSKPAPREVGDT